MNLMDMVNQKQPQADNVKTENMNWFQVQDEYRNRYQPWAISTNQPVMTFDEFVRWRKTNPPQW